MDLIEEIKNEQRRIKADDKARQVAAQEKTRQEELLKERLYLNNKSEIDAKIKLTEDYANELNKTLKHKITISKDKQEIRFAYGDRGFTLRFEGQKVTVGFGIAGDYEMQVSGVGGSLTTTIDKITIDKFTSWLRWLIQWKNSRPPVALRTVEDREYLERLKIGCLAALILIVVIVSCAVSSQYL